MYYQASRGAEGPRGFGHTALSRTSRHHCSVIQGPFCIPGAFRDLFQAHPKRALRGRLKLCTNAV